MKIYSRASKILHLSRRNCKKSGINHVKYRELLTNIPQFDKEQFVLHLTIQYSNEFLINYGPY